MKRVRINIAGLSFDISNNILMLILFFLTIYPFYYVLIYSFSDPTLAQKGVYLLPAGLTLDSYISVFKLKGMTDALFISMLRTVLGTVITVFCCTFMAYIVTKEQLLFRKAIYRYIIITMYFNAGFIPWYLTMKMYGLRNNFLLYIVPSAIAAYYIVLIKTFIEQLPAAMEESAKIDGAGYLTIFLRIIFPLSKPIVATIAVFSAVSQWNSWTDNFFLVESPKLMTLQLILYNYLNQANAISTMTLREMTRGLAAKAMTPQSIRMTITMVVTLPILFVYPFMQRYFVKGIMFGAVKG